MGGWEQNAITVIGQYFVSSCTYWVHIMRWSDSRPTPGVIWVERCMLSVVLVACSVNRCHWATFVKSAMSSMRGRIVKEVLKPAWWENLRKDSLGHRFNLVHTSAIVPSRNLPREPVFVWNRNVDWIGTLHPRNASVFRLCEAVWTGNPVVRTRNSRSVSMHVMRKLLHRDAAEICPTLPPRVEESNAAMIRSELSGLEVGSSRVS